MTEEDLTASYFCFGGLLSSFPSDVSFDFLVRGAFTLA